MFRRGPEGTPFSTLHSFISLTLAKMDGAPLQGRGEGEVQHAFYAAATASLPQSHDAVLRAEVSVGRDHTRRVRVGAMDFTLLVGTELYVLELLMFGNRRQEHLDRCVALCSARVRSGVHHALWARRFAAGGKYSSVGASQCAVIEFDVALTKRRPLHQNMPPFHYLVRLARKESKFVWEVTHRGKTRALKQVGLSRANSARGACRGTRG